MPSLDEVFARSVSMFMQMEDKGGHPKMARETFTLAESRYSRQYELHGDVFAIDVYVLKEVNGQFMHSMSDIVENPSDLFLTDYTHPKADFDRRL